MFNFTVKNAIRDGTVLVSTEGFLLKCNRCGEVRCLKTRESARRALVSCRVCVSCSSSDKVKGKKFSDERKLIHSLAQKRRYLDPNESKRTSFFVKSAMARPEVRLKHIESLSKSGFLGVKLDVGQLELLNKWNRLGFNFEPNYKIHTHSELFYVDGYDVANNVVFEYDSKYHKKISQKNKDFIRQVKIIEILNPKSFWRYDAVEKEFNCVYKNNNSVLKHINRKNIACQ